MFVFCLKCICMLFEMLFEINIICFAASSAFTNWVQLLRRKHGKRPAAHVTPAPPMSSSRRFAAELVRMHNTERHRDKLILCRHLRTHTHAGTHKHMHTQPRTEHACVHARHAHKKKTL